MSHTEGGKNAAQPSERVTNIHCNWDVLKYENNDDKETSRYKVQEKCHDLSIDIRFEQE